MTDWRKSVPQAIFEAADAEGVADLLMLLVATSKGYREVRGITQKVWAEELGCSVATVGRKLGRLRALGLVAAVWAPAANTLVLAWRDDRDDVSDKDRVPRGSDTTPDEVRAPRVALTNNMNDVHQGEVDEDKQHERQPSWRSGKEPDRLAAEMADSPRALARYFETVVRRTYPELLWTPNAPALAGHFRRWLDNGSVDAAEVRKMIEMFASELRSQSAYEAMQHEPRLNRNDPDVNVYLVGGEARFGYDARSKPDWPWRFFLAGRQRFHSKVQQARRGDNAFWAAQPDPYLGLQRDNRPEEPENQAESLRQP